MQHLVRRFCRGWLAIISWLKGLRVVRFDMGTKVLSRLASPRQAFRALKMI